MVGGTLPAVVVVALVQGLVLRWLHHLSEGGAGTWSELSFLLPAYACTVAVPLTYYLLRSKLGGRARAAALALVGVVLGGTAWYVGWVNGPVGGLYPSTQGAVFLFLALAVLGWFVALPFLSLGVRGSATPDGYAALFDEAWRLAITLAFAMVFTHLFWGLLSLFVALFEAIHVSWPRELVWTESFAYPATCVASSFAIGLTDVQPEMFRALRRLLLTVLRWLTVLLAAIVLLFLGTVIVEGVTTLWSTHFAAAGLIGTSIMLITLYNTVYQDGRETGRLPRALAWPVRAALIVGPALAGLAFWALALRIDQHGVSEDRLQAIIVVVILSGYLLGYSLVAIAGARAPFTVRHVNVVMALVMVATLVVIHSPVVDLKRVATSAQLERLTAEGDKLDFHYLRFQLGRYGLQELEELTRSPSETVAELAKRAQAETDWRNFPIFGRRPFADDRARFLARFEVYPRDATLPDDLIDVLHDLYRRQRWRLQCVDAGAPCLALLVDLDHDGQAEAVVPLVGDGSVYTRVADGWLKVGELQSGLYRTPDALRPELLAGKTQPLPPSVYGGVKIGEDAFGFRPCTASDPACRPGS